MSRGGPGPMGGVLTRETWTQTQRGQRHAVMEAETREMLLQAGERQGLLATTRAEDRGTERILPLQPPERRGPAGTLISGLRPAELRETTLPSSQGHQVAVIDCRSPRNEEGGRERTAWSGKTSLGNRDLRGEEEQLWDGHFKEGEQKVPQAWTRRPGVSGQLGRRREGR